MSSWLQALAQRLAGGPASHGRAEEISEIFYKRSLYRDTAGFLRDLLEIFPEGELPPDADLALLIEKLCGHWGAQKAQEEGELEAHIVFWRGLSERTASPNAHACYADALFCAGYERESIIAFTDALNRDPGLLDQFEDEHLKAAQKLGAELYLAYRLAVLRARLAIEEGAEDDSIREHYSELLEEFSGDPLALAKIRELGQALDAAVRRGAMPRALVRRRSDRDRN